MRRLSRARSSVNSTQPAMPADAVSPAAPQCAIDAEQPRQPEREQT